MRRFWKRDDGLDELKRDLRARRVAAPSAFMRALVQRAGGEERWLRPRMRFGFAAGLAVIALVAVASAGGFSAAQSTTHSAVKVLKRLTVSSPTQSTDTLSPSSVQYVARCGSPPLKKCELETYDVKLREGNAGCTIFTFRVVLKNGPSNEPVSVNYSTENGTALAGSDYVTAAGTLTWAPGETGTKTVDVCVIGDTIREPDEYFFFRLSAPSPNAKIVGKNPVKGTIQNDDH